jgi:hypothetical protein
MPPSLDDPNIRGDQALLRVLLTKWVTMKGGHLRPTSDSILDSNFENSCYVEGEISVEELRLLFPGLRIARIPVAVLRREGFAIERRPDEAPEGCTAPEAHVVVGPILAVDRGLYERSARAIVRDPAIEVLDSG